MTPVIARRLRIRGRVQGVGYRAWVEREALGRRLSGWVRNLADGSVEAVLSGDAETVEAMIADCWRGPSAAAVGAVEVTDDGGAAAAGFRVLPTA